MRRAFLLLAMLAPMLAAGLAAALVSWPAEAWACPVCSLTTEATRDAFISSTAFMSAVPLVLLGGAFYLVRKRYLELEEEYSSEPEDEDE